MKELGSICNYVKRYAEELRVRPDIHWDDFIFRFLIDNKAFESIEGACRYYFFDGRQSADNLMGLLREMGPRFQRELSLLEFASGYGCVTRHLQGVLPNVDLTACDIHTEAVQFINDRLQQRAILSHRNPKEFAPGETYDVIFSLSFFSHMPRATWGDWIAAHYSCLNAGGALIFTTHGLKSRKFFADPELPAGGFWFRADSEQKDLPTEEYGQTIVTREFVEGEIARYIGSPVSVFREGFWWGHQDLFVVLKPEKWGS